MSRMKMAEYVVPARDTRSVELAMPKLTMQGSPALLTRTGMIKGERLSVDIVSEGVGFVRITVWRDDQESMSNAA